MPPDSDPTTHTADMIGQSHVLASPMAMAAVVAFGSGAVLGGLPGGQVLAKTGTAEFTIPPLQTHPWMIASQGDLAVAAVVDVGESGSHTAGPILEQFLRGAH